MTSLDRLITSLDHAQEIELEDERHVPQWAEKHRDAAVLVPITRRKQPGVILTQRPQWLRSHAGQVAFPGGKIDETDEDAVAAALREADEELGIQPHQVEVRGAADVYYSGSGFAITPVIGLIEPDLPFDPSPDEVEDWFEVPFSFLFDPANAVRRKVMWQGQERQYYDMQWQDRRIWGVTAGIVANLIRRMEAVDAAA